MVALANTPVRIAPSVPPTPCTPKASSESSYPNIAFTTVAAKKQTTPPIAPMSSADIGVTNPLAGVITTSPATAPEIAPSTVGLPVLIHSANIQPSVAAAAAKCVLMNAALASPLDPTALPPLNPNHPTHSRHAPMTDSTTLCGGIGTLP